MKTEAKKNDYTIASVQRALRVLKLFDSQHKEMTLTEISSRADMRKGTMLRILETLCAEQFVRYDPPTKRYQLGVAVYALSCNAFTFNDLASVVRGCAEGVLRELNIVAHLTVLRENKAVLVDRILPNSSFSVYDLYSTIGGEVEIHCTGAGMVLTAFADPETRRTMLDGCSFARHSPNTVTDRGVYEERLAAVRKQGYAINNGENEPYLKCITYPIFNAKRQVFAALSFSGIIQCFTPELEQRCHKELREITRQVSREFGYEIL